MPTSVNNPSMPNVRASSGIMGTIFDPMFLSRNNEDKRRTKLLVVEVGAEPEPLMYSGKDSSLGVFNGSAVTTRLGTKPPSSLRRFKRYLVSGESLGGR